MTKNMVFSKSSVSCNQNCLKRAYIHNLLEEAIQKPAVTVVAGTGYGKTQAVYSFLQDSDTITTWQQLTSLDNISMRFWGNLINAISLHNEKLAKTMEIIGFPDTPAKINMFTLSLKETGIGRKKYVAVFDDFHLIHEKKILALLENVINAFVSNLCIILISRTEPEINWANLLVRDMIFNISEDDLRFNRSDLDQYFEMQNIQISPQTMSNIYDTTGGWVFAIRLIELSMKQGIRHEAYAIDAMRSNVFKLMENEIFSAVSIDAQRFLVKLSLFQHLPLELVRVLSSHHEHLVMEALKLNSFVRYDSFSNIYCIHHLFLDFLKQKQGVLTQPEKLECYGSAADWYAQNGYQIDAINYYEQAGDYEKILNIARSFPYALTEEVAALILGILSRASEEVLETWPLLTVLRARALASIERTDEALAELASLKKRLLALPETQKTRSILCEIHMVEGFIGHFICVFTNDFSFSNLFVKAFEYMPEGSAGLRGKHNNQSLGAYVCRVGNQKKEDIEKYISAISTAVPYVSKVNNGMMYGLDDLAKAELAYFRNQMKSAESFAYSASTKANKEGQSEIECRALFYLLRIALSAGDYQKIKAVLRQLDLQFETKSPSHKIWHDIVLSWFYAMIGCDGKVAGWLKNPFAKSNIALLVSGIENLAKMKYCLSIKNYVALFTFMENRENTFGIECFLLGKIALAVNKAVCLYRTGKQDEAIRFLQEAYELAKPNSLALQFVELGNDMVALTKFALKSEACAIPDEWLQSMFRKSSTYAKRVSYVASEYKKENLSETGMQFKLTKKELEFLTDLCHGISIAEIASNHSISKNYINNRLQTVYSKLGARNVKDAIHIATLMKLVK